MPLLVPLLVTVFGGLSIYVLMRRHGWGAAPSATWALASAPGAGFGLISVTFFYWVFAGLSPPGALSLAVLSAGLAIALATPVYCRRERLPWPAGVSITRRGSRGRRAALVAVAIAAAVGLGLLVRTLPQAAASKPFGGFDATAIWNVRALFLYRANGDLGEIFSGLKHGHPDYPLLLPASLAGQYSLLGGENVAIPQLTSLLFTLAAGAALFMAVTRLSSPAVAVAAVAVYWATPVVWRWTYDQVADIPLSYLLLMAVLSLSSQLDADRGRRLPPVLAGLFLGLLAWVKNEGVVQAALLAAAFAVLWWRRVRHTGAGAGRDAWRRPLWIVAGALPVLIALVLFKVTWSPVNETARFLGGGLDKALTLDRWLVVARAYGRELAPWSGAVSWGLLWPALALCAVAFRRHRVAGGLSLRLFDVALVLTFGLSVVAYVLTPDKVQWHLDTSLKRLLLQLTPLAMAWAVAGIGGRGSGSAGVRGSPSAGRPAAPSG